MIKPFIAQRCGNKEYPVLSITRHQGLILQSNRFKKEIASRDKSQYKVVPRNVLVVAFPIDEGLLCAQQIVDNGIVSPAYKTYRINEELIHPRILELILRSNKSISYYLSKMRGTTLRRRTLPEEEFQSMSIDLPSMSMQKHFIELLEQIDVAKTICKQIFQSFDNLVKFRFIEMFGNDDGIKTKWHVQHFVNCCNILYGFPLNSSLFNDNCEGMPIIRVRDINTGFAGTYSTEVVDQKYIMKRGDLLVSMDGDFRAIFWNDDPAILNQRTCKIECEPIMNKLFLLFVIRNELDRIHISTSSTTVKHLSAKEINKMKLPVPPIELQNEFADFVEQVDKSKFSDGLICSR